jgi:hypothetical protein
VLGRLIVAASKNLEGEPRLHVARGRETLQIFGMDVNGWKAGDAVEMSGSTPLSPLRIAGRSAAGNVQSQGFYRAAIRKEMSPT